MGKKRKQRDFDDTNPPKKRQKRSSKKSLLSTTESTPNSHVTITFANINGTIDATILPKQNVVAISSDVLLENKGKLSIKTSDPIQNDITPQIPIDIKILKIPNVKTIHPRNSFRMGTSLFYCMDEERLFWSFPLRNTRRVSCQHFCCAVSKIVTRSVGIHSNKCNGNHSSSTPCIYGVCNGKPPKGIIPGKLYSNYQYFQHSAKTDLLVSKKPNDEKFKKVPNTSDRSTMYSNIQIVANMNNGGPPPLVPMNDSIKNESVTKAMIKKEKETNNTKRRRPQTNANNSESHPFVQNVQIDLKALSKKKEKLKSTLSSMTCSTSNGTDDASHDYSSLLLHSTSSVVRDAQNENNQNPKKSKSAKEKIKHKQYIDLLLKGRFDEVIAMLNPYIVDHNDEKNELNEYRLLMATALYYRNKVENGHNDCLNALHFCNLIVSQCNEHNVEYYESRKIRGLIHKKLRNYKAACHDFEYICYQNPYHRTWRDKLYALEGKSNNLENKMQPKLNEIVTNNSNNIHILQNNNFYHQQQQTMTNPQSIMPENSYLNNSAFMQQSAMQISNLTMNAMDNDISNPNAPIVFIPSIINRNTNSNTKPESTKSASMRMETSLLDSTYSDLQQIQPRSSSTTSNGSFDGLLALAHAASTEYDKKQKKEKPKKDEILSGLDNFPSVMTRKTTMEELLGNLNDNDDLNDTMNATPEPMERIRSDALV